MLRCSCSSRSSIERIIVPGVQLTRGWKLQDFASGEGEVQGAYRKEFDHSQWLAVAVPGDVHRTLIDSGRIPDPFWDQNETACAWMEEREWWYRITFVPPLEPLRADERLRLVFHGLDTFASIWL